LAQRYTVLTKLFCDITDDNWLNRPSKINTVTTVEPTFLQFRQQTYCNNLLVPLNLLCRCPCKPVVISMGIDPRGTEGKVPPKFGVEGIDVFSACYMHLCIWYCEIML